MTIEKTRTGQACESDERVAERTAEPAQVNRRLQETLQGRKRIPQQPERSARESREPAEMLDLAHGLIFVHIDAIQEALVVLDPQLRIISANRSFHETFGTDPEQMAGQPLHTLGGELWANTELYHRLNGVLTSGGGFEGFEIECDGGEPKAFLLSARPIRPPAHHAERILLVIQDVTLCKRQQRVIEADKEQLGSLTEELLMIEEHTRDLTFEPGPSALDTLGLQAALEELAGQFAESEGFRCRVEGPGDRVPLNEQVRSLLYRAVRELLVNVAKHAQARNVRIVLGRAEQGFRIAVQDDGKGFDVSVLQGRHKSGGFGILSVRERLIRVGGAFAVESEQGQGTKVTMMVPLDGEQPSNWGFDGRPT